MFSKKRSAKDLKLSTVLIIIFSILVLLLFPAIGNSQTDWQIEAGHPKVFDLNQGQFDQIEGQEVLFHAKLGLLDFHFTESGYIATYYEQFDAREEKERWEKYEHGQPLKPVPLLKWEFNFENTNPNLQIIAKEKQDFTINYGDREGNPTIVTSAFKTLIYKNIYPNIDVKFTIGDEQKLKYDLILNPGANPNDISILLPQAELIDQLNATELSYKGGGFEFRENIPESYFLEDRESVDVSYSVLGNRIKFDVPMTTIEKTLVIDPWTVTVSPFTSGNAYYKVDWDDFGNVWAVGQMHYELAKFDDTGALQWVYIASSSTGFNLGGDFVIRHALGEAIYTPDWADDIYKLDPAGVMTDSYLTVAFPTEVWRVEYDEVNDQIILGKGGGFLAGLYMGVLASDFSSDVSLEVLPSAGSGVEDVVFTEIDPDGSTVYTLACGGGGGITGWNNDLVTLDLPSMSTPTNFTTNHNFAEAANGQYGEYVGTFLIPNSFNGIAVDATYIYTYDGNTLSQWDKSTETLVNEVILAKPVFEHGGLAIDECTGNLFVGTNDSVVEFDATLTNVGGYAMPGEVIDVRTGNGKLYVGGEGFLMQIDVGTGEPNLTATSASCVCDGTATADTTTCGSGTFVSIVWSPGGETTVDITGLCPGEYTAILTYDEGGSTVTYFDTVTVASSGSGFTVAETFTNEICGGDDDGTITLVPSGGTAPFTYDIGSATNTTGIFTGLPPGVYPITVTDDNGCEYLSSITIGAGAVLTATELFTNETCSGDGDGSITLSGGGGAAPYNYDIGTSSNTTGIFTGLPPATYSITITDDNGCTYTSSITIAAGTVLVVTEDFTDENCAGYDDGSITLTATTGSSPYNYDIGSASNTTGGFTGLPDGTYPITVTDDNGCTFSSSISIAPGIVLAVDEAFTDESCAGSANGTITLNATNGTGPYNYDIGSSSNTTGLFTGLANGTYTITVTDDNGCIYNSSITIATGSGLVLSTVSVNNPTCYGFTDGSITVNATGGVGPYDYTWTPINSIPGASFNNIGDGTYTVDVIDVNGCDATLIIVLTEPDSMTIDLNITDVLCHGDATGEVVVDTVNNHQGPFGEISYDWSSGPPGGIGVTTVTDLTAGQYTLDLTDSAGCAQSIEFIIDEPTELVFSEIGYEPAYCRLYGYQVGNGQVFAAATGGVPSYNYAWEEVGSSPPNTSVNTTWGGLNPGDYEITVTDANGCILTQIVSLDSVNPNAILDIDSQTFISQYEGMATLCITATNNSEYFANPLNPIADTTFWFSFDYPQVPYQLYQDDDFFTIFDTCYTEGGEYQVCLKIQNKNGCEDEECHTIIVHDPLVITAPNIFTPDGDGVNDVFTFQFLTEGVADFECLIVNRWGVRINEFFDITEGWDGTDRNGSESTDGVYFYIYKATGESGEVFEGQGTVQLIRNQ